MIFTEIVLLPLHDILMFGKDNRKRKLNFMSDVFFSLSFLSFKHDLLLALAAISLRTVAPNLRESAHMVSAYAIDSTGSKGPLTKE